MARSQAFVAPVAPPSRRRVTNYQTRAPSGIACLSRRSTRVAPLSSAAASPPPRGATVQVGQVVAVKLGSKSVSIARVTGVAASGDTVDVTLLDEFVRELYVEDKGQQSTYAAADAVRPVRAEYVPSQQGWIVLNQDLEAAKNYFEAQIVRGGGERVVVAPEPKRELSPDALEKQLFPRPTKAQAFLGAGLSLPIAALSYSAFAGARNAYQANPAGEELLSGEVFRKLVLFSTAAGSVATLVIGCALFLYALSATDE